MMRFADVSRVRHIWAAIVIYSSSATGVNNLLTVKVILFVIRMLRSIAYLVFQVYPFSSNIVIFGAAVTLSCCMCDLIFLYQVGVCHVEMSI